jgi:hypothetical protein
MSLSNYPEIENPRLGLSGPLIPLQLIDPEKAEVIYSVPASINRYLSEYQRQGVQFLYSRLSKGMGAILGKPPLRIISHFATKCFSSFQLLPCGYHLHLY